MNENKKDSLKILDDLFDNQNDSDKIAILEGDIKKYKKRLADVKRTEDKLERICPGCGSKITGICWECVGDGGLEK